MIFYTKSGLGIANDSGDEENGNNLYHDISK